MALDFTGTGDEVDCGSDSSLDDIGAGTIAAWVNKTTASWPSVNHQTDHITTKGNGVYDQSLSAYYLNADYFHFGVDMNTGAVELYVAVGSLPGWTGGEWCFIAVTWDVAGAASDQKMYGGNLTTRLSEASYVIQSVGSGGIMTNASANMIIGNDTDGSNELDGEIAFFAVWDTELTEAELAIVQFQPRNIVQAANLQGMYHLWGTGTQPDLSGTGNNGTVTGASASDHVPLGPPFAWDQVFPFPVAAPVGRTTKNTDPYGLGIAPGVSRTIKTTGL